jgi:PAS domain S-box-containing protein
MFRQRITRLKLILDVVISCGAMALLGWLVFVFPSAESQLSNIIQINWQFTYPILDFVILSLLINLILLVRSGILRQTMIWFLVGVISLTVGDLSSGTIIPGQPFLLGTGIDIGIVVGYSAILTGAILAVKKSVSLSEDPESEFERTIGRRIQGILPLAMTLVLVAELGIVWQNSINLPQVTVGITAMLWLLLIARQGVAAGEFEMRQYAILFQNTAEPSFITDNKMKILLVNPAMIRICGFQNESQLVGRSLGDIFNDPKLPPRIEKQWSEEVSLHLSPSISIPMELSLNQINLDSTGRQRIAGTAHDLSYQKEQQSALIKVNQRLSDLQAELERLNEGLEQRVIEKTNSLQTAYIQLEEQHKKLQSLDQMKSDFVSMVSHELRAPLTNISGGIELILVGREKLNDRIRSSISLVQGEIQRLSRFVETILDLSALEAGRLPVFVEPVSLNDIIQKTIFHFSGSPDAKRISFSENDSLPPVLADAQTLASALFHVVDNALKYAPIGQVLVTTEIIGDNIQVLVRDHGPGIPEEVQPYIFEKFYRVNPVDSQSVYGHGLGLFMAEKMMNAMGGVIKVRNCADGGAEFTFSLPIVKE